MTAEDGDPVGNNDDLRLTLDSDPQRARLRRGNTPDGKIERLIDLIGNEQFSIRVAATKKLSLLGEKAVPALMECLQKGLWYTRESAAQTLGNIGDSRAIGPLISGLKDENVGVRRAAACALVSMIGKERLSDVAKAIAQADQDAQRYVLETIRKASPLAGRKLDGALGELPEPSRKVEEKGVGERSLFGDLGLRKVEGEAGWSLWKRLRRFLEAGR